MRVKIINEFDGVVATGTDLFIDGVRIPELVNVELKHRVCEPARLFAEINAQAPFVVELNAEVNVRIWVVPGFKLEAYSADDNKMVYRAVPE